MQTSTALQKYESNRPRPPAQLWVSPAIHPGTWKLATSSAATNITHSTRKLCKVAYHLPREHAPGTGESRSTEAERYHRHVAGGNDVRAGLPALPLPRPVAVGPEPNRAAARAPRPRRLPLPPLSAGVLPAGHYSKLAMAAWFLLADGVVRRLGLFALCSCVSCVTSL